MKPTITHEPEESEGEGNAYDLFAFVPVVAAGVETREDAQGRLQIRGSVPSKPGVTSFLARQLGFHRHIRVNLDTLGSLFWKQIDGRRKLRDIEARLRKAASLDEKDSQRSTILFTKMLMRRHLIDLRVPAREEHAQ